MNTAEPDPVDPLLRALAEHWTEVLGLADEEQRERLRGLVDGTIEPNPVDARVALQDELLMLLPPDHPLVEVLRTGVMLASGVLVRDEFDTLVQGFQLLLRVDGGGSADVPVPDGIPADPPTLDDVPTPGEVPAPGRGSATGGAVTVGRAFASGGDRQGHDAPSPIDEFDQQVQARLLALPSLSPDELRGRGADPDDSRLIRLTHPDRGDQLPAFQFTESGQPWAVVRQVNERLNAEVDPWGVTCWWVDPHARLDVVPADLIGQGRDALLLRAAAAMAAD